MDAEKGNAQAHHVEELSSDFDHEDNQILVDINVASGDLSEIAALKLAKDGHTILIPQPSDDPQDPLNWPWWRKHAILLTIGTAGFLAEFAAAGPTPCILLQGAEWNISPNRANYPTNLSILMVALGGVIAIPFLYFWGRAPVFFWCILVGALFTLGCAIAPTFEIFYGLRVVQGLWFTGTQTAGLSVIHDLFFFHEEVRKIGIWTVMFIVSPYLGPMFANFILAGTLQWRNVYWMVFGLACFNLALVVAFFDETWYRRDLAPSQQPARGSRLLRITGVWQIRNHNHYFLPFGRSVRRLWVVFWKPIIIPVVLYYMSSFMWAVGINQTTAILFAAPASQGGYGFGSKASGYLYFAPVIAVALGEGFGHFFNDYVAKRYIRKHQGRFVPEARLSPIYVAAIFMIPGLVLVGQALHHHLSWVAIALGWGMFVFGCMVASVAITAYALDAYPSAGGEVSSFINLSRLLGGFSVGYFQLGWGLKSGFNVSFGIQAAVVAAGVVIVPILRIWGAKLRHKGGLLNL